jgi:hypothetical protein
MGWEDRWFGRFYHGYSACGREGFDLLVIVISGDFQLVGAEAFGIFFLLGL